MKRFLLCAAAVAALSACSAGEDTAAEGEMATVDDAATPVGTEPPASAMPTPSGAEYVAMAGAGDLYETQSSRAVLETTENAELRRFAEMMVDNHAQTTTAVTTAAREAGLAPAPPALDAPKTEMMRELQAAEGSARDAVYVRQQVTAHEQALALHQTYASNGDQPALKAAAASAVPIVERHLTEIRRIQTAMAPA